MNCLREPRNGVCVDEHPVDHKRSGFALRILVRYAIAGLVLAALVSGAMMIMVPAVSSESGVSVTYTEFSPEPASAAISYFDAGASETIELLKDSTFDTVENWTVHAWDPLIGSSFDSPQRFSELQLQNGMVSMVHRGINVAHRYYSRITITLLAEVISGECNITVTGNIDRAPLIVLLSENSTTMAATSGSHVRIVLNVALHQSLRQGLDIAGLLRTSIEIDTSSLALIQFKSLTIQGVSETPLYPVVINSRSSDGQPLFSNPLQQAVRYYPIVLIQTSPVNIGHIAPRLNHEVIYLPAGTFDCQLGWSDYESLTGDLNFTLEIQPGKGVNLTTTFVSTPVDITINPKILYSIYITHGQDYPSIMAFVLSGYLQPANNGTLYFPPLEHEIVLHITPVGFRAYSRAIPFDVNSTRHYHILVENNILMIGPFAMQYGQLFLLIFLISLVVVICVRIQKAAAPRRVNDFLKDRRGLPILLMFISGFLPWLSYSLIEPTEYVLGHSVQVYDFPIILLQANYVMGSHIYFTFETASLLPILLLFWGAFMLAIDNFSFPKQDYGSFSVAIVVPTILVITMIILFGLQAFQPGEMAAFTATALWFVQAHLKSWQTYTSRR